VKSQQRKLKVVAAVAGAGVRVSMGAVTVACGSKQANMADPTEVTAPTYPSPPATTSGSSAAASSSSSTAAGPPLGGAGNTTIQTTPGAPATLGGSMTSQVPASTPPIPAAAPPLPAGPPPFA
jgi:hypothetical protein